MKRLAVALSVLSGFGCGYVGEPLPPLLNVPERVSDLSGRQIGSKIILEFSVPRLTTEGVVIKRPVRIESRGGPAPAGEFDADAWASEAKDLGPPPVENGRARFEIPSAEWAGKEVVFAVKVYGHNERTAGWSNLAILPVTLPPAVPAGIQGDSVAEGIRLRWRGTTPSYRIFRRMEGEQTFAAVAESGRPEWVDNAVVFGKSFHYRIQGFQKTGETTASLSEISAEFSMTPADTFPPAVPAGLTAVPSTSTIELAWDRNTEPDLAGYRVYRDGKPVAATGAAPSYSDREIQPGTQYRYAVAAVDKSGNESEPCESVGIAAP